MERLLTVIETSRQHKRSDFKFHFDSFATQNPSPPNVLLPRPDDERLRFFESHDARVEISFAVDWASFENLLFVNRRVFIDLSCVLIMPGPGQEPCFSESRKINVERHLEMRIIE